MTNPANNLANAHNLFVTCASGLEPCLTEELTQLGFAPSSTGFRGVHVPYSLEAIYTINYCSRLASRVLLPLIKFECRDQKDLYTYASKIDWPLYIPKGKTFAIDAHVDHDQLRNSLYAAQVVKDAVCDVFRASTGDRPSVEPKQPDIQLNLFIHHTAAVISLDTSGGPLHKRSYRQKGGGAPLQESLAAAILHIARYQADDILCDPCCGSGTLLIEAAYIASQTPPGFLRKRWGFMAMPGFNEEEWLKIRVAADAKRIPLKRRHFTGLDINNDAVDACLLNLSTAGFSKEVDVRQSDFRIYTPRTAPTIIVCNPPYGKRMDPDDDETLHQLYSDLGDFMKQKGGKPSRGFILTGNLELGRSVGLKTSQKHILSNGGIDSRLLEYRLY